MFKKTGGLFVCKDKTYLYFCMEKPSEHIFNEKNKSLDALAAVLNQRSGLRDRSADPSRNPNEGLGARDSKNRQKMTSHNPGGGEDTTHLGARGVVPPGIVIVKFGMVANFMSQKSILLMPYTPVTTKVPTVGETKQRLHLRPPF